MQYLRPQIFDGGTGLLTIGADLLATQTAVGLLPSVDRDPIGVFTSAHARVTNGGGYIQQNLSLYDRKPVLGGGLRWDVFRFRTEDFLEPQFSGASTSTELQPKASVGFTPSHQIPLKLFFNYGRGISSLDARGVVREPEAPHIATTDFHQLGTTHLFGDRFSLLTDFFFSTRTSSSIFPTTARSNSPAPAVRMVLK